jgi:hypothetical protein
MRLRHRRNFFLRVAQIKKAEDFLYDKLPTRAMEVQESQGSHWVRQGWSNAADESVRKLGREKKETKEGKKVAQVKARFRVSQIMNSFFWFTNIGVLRDPSRLKYRLLRYFFTRKPCAKEVPETDYLTQQKQYLKRTTLRRLNIPLQTICSKEGLHYRLSEAWARKLSSDKRQSTFIHGLEIPLVISYLGYTA